MEMRYFGHPTFFTCSFPSISVWVELKTTPSYRSICPTSTTIIGKQSCGCCVILYHTNVWHFLFTELQKGKR
jgi:hypothetical protein